MAHSTRSRILVSITLTLLLGLPAQAALKNATKVFRGGVCTAESFREGSDQGSNYYGKLTGISVYAKDGTATAAPLKAANSDFLQRTGCWTKVQDIKAAGGTIVAKPVAPGGPDHYEIDGLTDAQLESIFKNKRW